MQPFFIQPSIMIIDDNELDAFILRETITSSNVSNDIIGFSSGFTAMEYFKEISKESSPKLPDIIFLDINMPYMNGFQFIDLLIEIFPDVNNNSKIIMLTSSDDPEDVKNAAAYENIIGYCEKPISMQKFRDDIINKIRNATIFYGHK